MSSNDIGSLEFENQILRTKIKELETLIEIYRHDELTGFKMRRDFELDIREMFKLHKIFLYIIDINGLHNINREFGYDAGDEMIKQISREIHKTMDGIPYRLGGDEFAIISAKKQNVDINNIVYGVVCNDEFESVEEMMKQVDKQVIEAKKVLYKGRNDRRKNES